MIRNLLGIGWLITGINFYSFGATNLYLPLPYPLTALIKPAFLRMFKRFPTAVMEMLVISIISLRPNTLSKFINANNFLHFSLYSSWHLTC